MTVIALVGAPGSGKSTLGGLLAQRLAVGFADADAVIKERQGRDIRDIFASDGEDAFRVIERDVTLELLAGDGVVSLGGGAPLIPDVSEALAGVATVWLKVDARNAVRRIGLDEAPFAGGVRGTFIRLLNDRTPIYRSLADVEIDTNGREPNDLVDATLAALKAL